MNWDSFDTWTAVIGALCAVSCALPGCFLLLRGMSMMGDAISHAVLPGLALAFLVTHSRTSVVMFVGAALVGLMTAVFTQWLSRFGKVDRGAAMGIVFTTLFAIGLILIYARVPTEGGQEMGVTGWAVGKVLTVISFAILMVTGFLGKESSQD